MSNALKLAQLLVPLIQSLGEYKRTRDRMIAAGEVSATDGAVKTDEELILLFKGDAQSLSDNAQALINKYQQ